MGYERFEFLQRMYSDVNVLRIGDALVDTGHVASSCRNEVTGRSTDLSPGSRPLSRCGTSTIGDCWTFR